jgi:hypothetical protein
VYREHFKWVSGLHVIDWRYIVRICNIGSSDLTAGDVDLVTLMITAQHRLFKQGVGRTIIYSTREIVTALDHEAQKQGNVYLSHAEYGGEYLLHFRKFPIRECDSLIMAEETVA